MFESLLEIKKKKKTHATLIIDNAALNSTCTPKAGKTTNPASGVAGLK